MLVIPTDSLSKFLAIGSIISMVLLMDICLKNYEKAELAFISVYVKGEEFREQYKEYSGYVNKGIQLHNNTIQKKTKLSDTEREQIMLQLDRASSMNPKMQKMSLEVLELTHKAILYQRLKYIWIALTALALVLCSFSAFIGFKGWYLGEKKNTIS